MTATDEIQPHEAADLAARLAELKQHRYILEKTGEQMTTGEWEREEGVCKRLLKRYIIDQGTDDAGRYHPVIVEGLPPLELTIPERDDVDLPALLEHEPDIFYELVACNLLTVDTKTAAKVLNPDRAMRLKRWIHRIGITPRLAFRRNE